MLHDSKNSTQSQQLTPAVPGLTESMKLQYQSPRPFSPLPKSRFKINYVLCIEMFTCNQEEHSIAFEPEQDTMEFLIRQICDIHNLQDVLTLELYNKNGTPLNVNDYTITCKLILFILLVYCTLMLIVTLEKWKIKNNDSFYALPRRRKQPSWDFPEPLNDTIIDPTEGTV